MASKKLTKSNNRADPTSDVLNQTLSAAIEGLTGVATSDKQALLMSLGRILQRIRGGRFLSQLQAEWEEYRNKGRVTDDYVHSSQHQECLQELLDFLDGESPDQLRFDALKRIFLNAANDGQNDPDSVLPQQYMRIIRSLSAGETVLLFSAYRDTGAYSSAHDWLNTMANCSGLRYPELVELHEEGLMSKRLLTQRRHSDRSGVMKGPKGRVTGFGYNMCQFIEVESLKIPGIDDA